MTDVAAAEPQQAAGKAADAHPDTQSSSSSDDELKGSALQELEGEDLDELQEDPEPEDEVRQSALERRTTWIGEGLIDLGGMDAVDRLSDIRSYEDLVKHSLAYSGDSDRLKDFLTTAPPPMPPMGGPDGDRHAAAAADAGAEPRRSKLLDFLANDVGERYLDGVYENEERDNEPSDESASDSEVKPQVISPSAAAVDDTKTRSRADRANSKLLAFLAQERGERMHLSEGGERRLSLSSAASSSSASSHLSSNSTGHMNANSSKLLNFVTKVVADDKPRRVIFDVGTDELHQLVAEEAQRKKKKREEKEKARQKVLAFLAEEEHKSPGGEAKGEVATIKSVDEASVRRETVIDRYGTVQLVDAIDRSDRGKQRQFHRVVQNPRTFSGTDTSASNHDSASEASFSSPSSAGSAGSTSPRSLTASVEKENPKHVPGVSSHSSGSRFERAGNRIASLLHRTSGGESRSRSVGSNGSSRSTSPPPQPADNSGKLDRLKRILPPSTSSRPASHNSSHSSGDTRGTSHMTSLLASLDQLTHTCQKTELSEVAIARIQTLLTSVHQIVRDDVARHHGAPNRVVRRMSATPTWVKNAPEEQDNRPKAVSPQSTPPASSSASAPEPSPVSSSAVVEHLKVQAAPGVLNSFKAFEGAQDLVETLATFNKLLTDCGLNGVKVDEPWRVYNHIKAAVASKLGFRQKQLFKLLDTKMASGEVYKRKPCAHKRVCLVGSGPVGLRAAVELALLGAQVVVLEKRKHFSRENILHLWPWVVQDLTALGAKVLFPPFCHSTAYFHVGTRQLQCILLKVALLLGVTVYSSTTFESLTRPDAPGDNTHPFFSVATKPQIPWMEFTAVLGAAGTQDVLSQQAGINRFIFSRKEAIGLVCYFANHGTTEEKKVPEFSWTVQFKQQKFAQMREIGIDLENIVYYRGEMHYIVMTPKRQNLLEQGVLKINYPQVSDLVSEENMDRSALNEYVTRVVKFLQIPQKAEFQRLRMFDFSTRTRADKAASILSARGKKLYVGMIGDALLEPFWPEGLGTCRGFLGALDGVWMVAQAGQVADEQLLADRELAYRITQHVSGFRRDDLQKNVRKYSVDPKTRYTVKFPQLC